MGKSRSQKRKIKNKAPGIAKPASAKASPSVSSEADHRSPEGKALELQIIAEPDFYEKVEGIDVPAKVIENGSNGAAGEGLHYAMHGWGSLAPLLDWFQKGTEADPTSKLVFSSLLTKEQRAVVHRLAESLSLDTISSGVADDRVVTVMKKGSAPQKPGSTLHQTKKAFCLWKWSQEAGLKVSRDEASEMVMTNKLTPEVEKLWAAKGQTAQLVNHVCEAIGAGDTAAVQAALQEHPQFKGDDLDTLTGISPMHLAAKLGNVDVLQMLLRAGANVDVRDKFGQTPLQISRKFEQCDAEGALLQGGAHDPQQNHVPVVSEAEQPAHEDAHTNGHPETTDEGLSSAPEPAAELSAAATSQPSAQVHSQAEEPTPVQPLPPRPQPSSSTSPQVTINPDVVFISAPSQQHSEAEADVSDEHNERASVMSVCGSSTIPCASELSAKDFDNASYCSYSVGDPDEMEHPHGDDAPAPSVASTIPEVDEAAVALEEESSEQDEHADDAPAGLTHELLHQGDMPGVRDFRPANGHRPTPASEPLPIPVDRTSVMSVDGSEYPKSLSGFSVLSADGGGAHSPPPTPAVEMDGPSEHASVVETLLQGSVEALPEVLRAGMPSASNPISEAISEADEGEVIAQAEAGEEAVVMEETSMVAEVAVVAAEPQAVAVVPPAVAKEGTAMELIMDALPLEMLLGEASARDVREWTAANSAVVVSGLAVAAGACIAGLLLLGSRRK